MCNFFKQALNDLVHFQYEKQRSFFFSPERYSRCWIPNVGFSIHGQEFDEYGAAEDVNDAHPRAHELTRGQKAGRNKSGRGAARARGRANMKRRKSGKERGLHGRERG